MSLYFLNNLASRRAWENFYQAATVRATEILFLFIKSLTDF